ncbi:MAG: hypothetical protein AB8W35_03630 [Coxiella endosymbiont of Dermacentor nuttalli]
MNFIKIFIENTENNLQKRKPFSNILPELTSAKNNLGVFSLDDNKKCCAVTSSNELPYGVKK